MTDFFLWLSEDWKRVLAFVGTVFLIVFVWAHTYERRAHKVPASIKTPLSYCMDAARLADERNDKSFRMVCEFEGFGIEAGQLKGVEMPELIGEGL